MTTATKDRSAKLQLTAGELLRAVQDVSRAISRGPKPILKNVRIGDGVITATDLEIQIEREIGVVCEPMLLPADRLLAILRSCDKNDTVTISRDGASCKVRAGRGSWSLPTEDVQEYPTWNPTGAYPVARLPADQFVRAVDAVAYATDSQSSRFALGAVLIDVTSGDPTFVATDGRRLAAVQTETDQAVNDRQTLVPCNAITHAAALARGTYGSVQIEATKSEVIFTLDGATVTARLVDGKFPPWRDVFPADEASPARIDRSELLAATRAAAIVTSEQSVGVDYEWSAGHVTLTAKSSEYGESKVKCPISDAGSCDRVKINPAFLRDFLDGIPHDEDPSVELATHGRGGAVVLQCGPYRGVIMPLAEDA